MIRNLNQDEETTSFRIVQELTLHLQPCLCPAEIRTKLKECLVEPVYFDEIAMSFTRMQTECRDFMASFKEEGFPLEEVLPGFVIPLFSR